MGLFSIRTKLFLLVFAAFVLLVGIIYWQIGMKAKAVSIQSIDRSLSQSSTILDARIESRFRFIREIANGIARDGRVLPLVAEQQSLTLQDLSMEYVAVYDFDILFFMNSRGDILARADQPDAIGVNLANRSSLFDDALAGRISSGFIASEGKLMQSIAAPVFDNVAKDLVKGVVVLAYELSRDTAEEIVTLTQSQIGFFTFTRNDTGIINGIEASYMSDHVLPLGDQARTKMDDFINAPDAWKAILDSASDDMRATYIVDAQTQHSVFRRINSKDGNPLGFVVAMRSNAALEQPFTEIKQALLIVGAICVIIASLFAILIAIRISKPIVHLVDLTKQIQDGFYPNDSHKSLRKDEVGLLQNALVTMGQSLKDKADFEAYLADLASEIEADYSLSMEQSNIGGNATIKSEVGSENLGRIIEQRYRILSALGSGTMGTVYLAEDLELEEKVAIKVMQKAFFDKIEGINVKEEIRLARKITHRNIVRTFDYGTSDKEIFITMEYVQGFDLGRLIKEKGALDLNIGLTIMKQICSAMIAAHESGVIHRDLKPGNMIINRQGILKIMDFGLAMQVKAGTLQGGVNDIQDSPTQENTEANSAIMGTPRFMAPEQFTGSDTLDERTDIYAMGVIMFTIFNGKAPFTGGNIQQLAMMHCNLPIPDLTGCSPDFPKHLITIIHTAMAKSPEARYQNIREMLAALES